MIEREGPISSEEFETEFAASIAEAERIEEESAEQPDATETVGPPSNLVETPAMAELKAQIERGEPFVESYTAYQEAGIAQIKEMGPDDAEIANYHLDFNLAMLCALAGDYDSALEGLQDVMAIADAAGYTLIGHIAHAAIQAFKEQKGIGPTSILPATPTQDYLYDTKKDE